MELRTPDPTLFPPSLLEQLLKEADSPTPTYWDFLNKTWISFQEFGLNSTRYPYDPDFTSRLLRSVRSIDVVIVFLVAVLWTIARHYFSIHFFRPFTRRIELNPRDTDKWCESAWKTVAYVGLWTYSLYVMILSGRYDFFHYPLHIWKGQHFTPNYLQTELPSDMYWMYMLQTGFYVHGVYATIFMDDWRKDSVMMLFHHALTIFLLEFSFMMKFHRIGALLLFLHDISDIILEGTKVNVYMKRRNGRYYWIHDLISSAGFVLFTSTWALFRLYWYPLKVIHAANWGVYITQLGCDPKMYLIFNGMLWMLLALHVYWFYFIVLLLVKIATGQMTGVEDVREFEVEQRYTTQTEQQSSLPSTTQEGAAVTNGTLTKSVDGSHNHGNGNSNGHADGNHTKVE